MRLLLASAPVAAFGRSVYVDLADAAHCGFVQGLQHLPEGVCVARQSVCSGRTM